MQEEKSAVHTKVHEDYLNNFMPRSEANERLSCEEIEEFFKDKDLLGQVHVNWHFKFYVKQLLMLSFNRIKEDAEISVESKTGLINNLIELVQYDQFNETRALVAFLRLEFDRDNISDFHLHDIFAGSFTYDDYCAQIAYYEYNMRKK